MIDLEKISWIEIKEPVRTSQCLTNTVDGPDMKFSLYFGNLMPCVLVDFFGKAEINLLDFGFIPTLQECSEGSILKDGWINTELQCIIYIGAKMSSTVFAPNIKNKGKLVELFKKLEGSLVRAEKKESKFSIIINSSMRGLMTKEITCKPDPIKDDNYKMFYGDKFPYEEILGFENAKEGLMLLHGEPGTGKTNFIKNLLAQYKKSCIYLPPNSLALAASPDFLPFLMNNSGKILLIEDGEEILQSFRNVATQNLLNMTSGFLKDVYDIKVIATFNTDIKNIDNALTRDGRLYLEYEFKKLSVEEANRLSNFCGLGKTFKEESTLAQIFSTHKNREEKEEAFIGFR